MKESTKDKIKLKRDAFLNWSKSKKEDAKVWISENKGLIIIMAPIVVGAVSKAINNAGKQKNLQEQARLKENYCYDNHLGMYWELRRPMSNYERLIFEERKSNGYPIGQILDDMKLLK